MGQVYRATDTKLKRHVAIKILPPVFAADADRLARFQREAQVLASLNHPNIAAIHGLEESGGITALVMELVEGDDLSQRIARGVIPLDEALPIARQIAEALEAAHEQAIIHRDLKPANIKVRADGTVKVLDFGLAKALEPTGSSPVVTQSPTIMSPAMTHAGIILGTAAYMSPEQARGTPVDKRTDIWAFGAVLFEMLSAQRAFGGQDVVETIAAVVRQDVDWSVLPPATPTSVRRLLARCLNRDVKDRLRDIGEARVTLSASRASDIQPAVIGVKGGSRLRRLLPWAVTATSLAATVVVTMLWAPWSVTELPRSVRLSSELGGDLSLAVGAGESIAFSPDGALVALVARNAAGETRQLYIRRLEQLQTTALYGTEGAENPFFSPDSQWVAFFADGKLKKIAVAGGGPQTVCEAPNGRGGTWAANGNIMFSPTQGGALVQVSDSGGTPQPLTTLSDGEVSHRWPQAIDGGRAVLYTASGAGGLAGSGSYDDANLVLQVLPAGSRTIVQRGGYHGRYVRSAAGTTNRSNRESGHIVYLNNGTLFAVPFSANELRVTGRAIPVIEGVVSSRPSGGAQFSVSPDGTLVYLRGPSSDAKRAIDWMDRAGTTTTLRATRANWFNIQFAPDGRRLALQINDGQNDIWVYEQAQDTLTRLTFHAANDLKPVWTPDGRRITFASARETPSATNLYWQRADGGGVVQRLTENPQAEQQPGSWHPSGKYLAFQEVNRGTNVDLMILQVDGDETSGWRPGTPTVFLRTPASERDPMFSPDGRWLAYVSNEGGRADVYVQPFPGPGGKRLISSTGGSSPTWSRTKRELFFTSTNGQLMVNSYSIEGDSFRPGKSVEIAGRIDTVAELRMFDLHPDGERFAVAPVLSAGMKADHLTFVFKFFDELRRIAPPSP